MVSWAWWDWPLTSLTNRRPSVLWRCWLGHLTRKIVSEMTYNVSSGRLHPTVPYYHRLSPFLAQQPLLIQICITPSVESTPGFFPSASPVMFRLTSSFTCQLISIIITTLIIHHSFTLSLQAQNLPFQQILPTLDFFYLPDCLHDNGTGPDLSCSSFNF